MDIKQGCLDLYVGDFKIEQDVSGQAEDQDSLSRKTQICTSELQDVFVDRFNNFKTMEKFENTDVIKQEIIECEVPKIEERSDYLLPEIKKHSLLEDVQFSSTIKKEVDKTSEVKEIDIHIKQEINEYIQPKIESELLTTYCDLPTLKNESIDSHDYILEPLSSKHPGRILKPLKDILNTVPRKKSRKYLCPVCQEYFPSSNSRSKHLNGHFRKSFVVCMFCGKLMKKNGIFHHYFIHLVNNRTRKSSQRIGSEPVRLNNIELTSHTKNPINNQPLIYSPCAKQLKQTHIEHSVNNLIIPINEKQFGCDICFKQFITNASLQQHLKSHTVEKLFKCDICPKVVKSKFSLQYHFRTHTNEKPFKCHICPKGFKTNYFLKHHLLTHINEKPFTCGICSKKFAKLSGLQQHLLIHTQEKTFKCDTCSKRFLRKYHLKTHLLTHADEKPFTCDVCSKKFTTERHLQQHLITHTEKKPFKCEICSREFNWRSGLQGHLLIHTNDKPFKCHICFKGFTEKIGFQHHLLMHTKEKPFKCDICSIQFHQKSNLQRHLATHTNKRPFRCDVCSKEFKRKDTLQKHLKTHTK